MSPQLFTATHWAICVLWTNTWVFAASLLVKISSRCLTDLLEKNMLPAAAYPRNNDASRLCASLEKWKRGLIHTIIKMAAAGRRKILTLDDHVYVLKRIDNGESCRSIAAAVNNYCGKSQISSICSDRAAILKEWESGARYDLTLLLWFLRERLTLLHSCDVFQVLSLNVLINWQWTFTHFILTKHYIQVMVDLHMLILLYFF